MIWSQAKVLVTGSGTKMVEVNDVDQHSRYDKIWQLETKQKKAYAQAKLGASE